jgi:hypothetical protein
MWPTLVEVIFPDLTGDVMALIRILTSHSLIAILGLLGAVFLVMEYPQEKVSSQQRVVNIRDIELHTQTNAFGIIKLTQIDDRHIQITLHNYSDKVITAYQFLIGSTRVTGDLAYHKKSLILPGTERDMTYTLNPSVMERGISVLAVVFEDMTGDGDFNAIKEIDETRLGKAKAYSYFFSRIQSLSMVRDSDLFDSLQTIKQQIISIPESEDMPVNVRYGFHNGKQDIVEEIEAIRPKEERAKIDLLKERFQQITRIIQRQPTRPNIQTN